MKSWIVGVMTLLLSLTVAVGGSAYAAKDHKEDKKAKHDKGNKHAHKMSQGKSGKGTDKDVEKSKASVSEQVRQYYLSKEDGEDLDDDDRAGYKKGELPKGLQKKLARGGELPPGWQKKLARGEVLSPELKASGEPVSDELEQVINQQDAVAAEVIRIQDKLVRVSKGEGTVLDIIDLADVLAGRGMRSQDQ